MNEQSPRRHVGAALGALLALPVLAWSASAAADEPAAATAAPEAAAETPADVPDAPAADQPVADAPIADAPAANAPAADAPVAEPAAAAPIRVATTASADLQADTLGTSRRASVSSMPWIGAMADVGVPDGATVSVVVRPIRPVRIYAGLSHNMISLGQRAGVTLTPGWWVSPTLTVEYGRFAEGNANPLVRTATGDATFSSAVLERIGYDYASARLGLELGRKWFTFYLHAGISRITGEVHNLEAETMSESTGTTTVTFSQDPSIRVWAPSANLGFIVYLAK